MTGPSIHREFCRAGPNGPCPVEGATGGRAPGVMAVARHHPLNNRIHR